MTDVISDDLMKASPGGVSPTSRQRNRVQGPASIYVPPPLRKRKNSSDSKKRPLNENVSQKSKFYPGREISLNLDSSSSKLSDSKKCENSYLLFGLEYKNSLPASKNDIKICSKSQGNEEKFKECSPNIKKCDNSYLLFSADSNDPKSKTSNSPNSKITIDRQSRKQMFPFKAEQNDTLESYSIGNIPFVCDKDPHPGNVNCENLVGVQSVDSIISPINFVPEDLSCKLDSLSVDNKSPKFIGVPKYAGRENIKSLKQSSQRKCDDSSLLFDNYSSKNEPFISNHFPIDKQGNTQEISSQPSFDSLSASNVSHKFTSPNTDDNLRCDRLPMMISNDSLHDSAKSDDTSEKSDKAIPGTEASDSIEDYVVEIYDFPKTLRTQDIMTIFSSYSQDGFLVKWVDETHALGIFSNPFLVSDVLKKNFDIVSVRPLQNGSPAAIDIASTLPVPSAPRPKTCPSLARRLVSGALGLRVLVSDEIKQAEKKMLQQAKEERRLAAKQREEAWEGTLRSNLGT